MFTAGALRYDDYLDTATLTDSDDRIGRPAREDWSGLMVSAEEVERFSAKVIAFQRRGAQKVALLRLKGQKLSVPLVVSVEDTADGVVISNEALNVWGAGDNRYSAIDNFSQTFIDVLDSYSQTADEHLTRDARQYLADLRRYIP